MKARSVDVLHVAARLCGLAIAVIAAGSCAPDDSMSASPSEKSPTAPVNEQCGAECHLTRSSWVLAASADTAAQSRPIAEGRIIGQRGGELAIVVTGDGAVLRALRDLPALVVRVNDSVRRLEWPAAGAVVLVHRFNSDEERVDVSYEIVPTSSKVPPGRLVLTQRLKGAQVISLTRRYAGWLSAGPKSLIGDAGCTGDVAIPGPGTYCGTVVTIAPYVPNGGPFGGWQSNEGTGQSFPIEITFSSPVGSVRLTAIDPNFPGNLMTAYNAAGGQVGQVEFTGNGQPGAIPPPRVTRTIAAAGIRRVVLQPASGEYVAYEDLAASGSVQDSLRLVCTPSPVVRGEEVTCRATLNSNSTFAPIALTTSGIAGLTVGSVVSVDGDRAAESRGPAIATAQASISVVGPGMQTLSATAMFEVTPRQFANPTLPATPTVLNNTIPESFCPFFSDCILPVLGAYTPPVLAPNAAASIQILRPIVGPQVGLAILLAPPALDFPFVHLGEPLGGIGTWYADQNGVHGGATIGPNGLPYCVGSNITGALRTDVIRHEGAAPPQISHYSLWLTALESAAARDVFESFTFPDTWTDAQVVVSAEQRLFSFRMSVGSTQTAWDLADLGGSDLPLPQQRIGCAFDTINPGD